MAGQKEPLCAPWLDKGSLLFSLSLLWTWFCRNYVLGRFIFWATLDTRRFQDLHLSYKGIRKASHCQSLRVLKLISGQIRLQIPVSNFSFETPTVLMNCHLILWTEFLPLAHLSTHLHRQFSNLINQSSSWSQWLTHLHRLRFPHLN